MDSVTLMVGFGLVMAVIGGYFVARESVGFEPVRGGALAQVGHFVACAVMSGLPAALLVMLIVTIFTAENLVEEFVLYAVISLLVAVGALLVYAVGEPDAPVDESALPPLD